MNKGKKISSNRALIKEQIMAIRDSGKVNMFDKNLVQRMAHDMDYFELVCFIEDLPDNYLKFIMSGDDNLIPM